MGLGDIGDALNLWRACEGIGLSEADSEQGIAAFLSRNPGLSHVARGQGVLVGAVLCGHDGRRGYVHHLAVAPDHRHQGIGTVLARACMDGLVRAGVAKAHAFVYRGHEDGVAFWYGQGWSRRTDLEVVSRLTSAATPA